MILERVAAVRERIARASSRADREASAITLIAVSKNHPSSAIREAYRAGLRDFGENRVQEAERKVAELSDLGDIRWHLVGHLQSNKARKAVPFAHLLHSLDSVELAARLDRVAAELDRILPALVQVDLASEEAKFGLSEGDLPRALEAMRGLSHLELRGLMLMPPYEDDPERVRPFFRRLREIRDRALEARLLAAGELSMGMSHDLEPAVEEGATIVRVGTAIFGERSY